MSEVIMMNDEELNGVTGGNDGKEPSKSNAKSSYKVIATIGVNIRSEPNSKSAKRGNAIPYNTVLKNCSDNAVLGVDGLYWIWMPKQKGFPSGYITKNALKKITK